jgi:hypothetical protein
MERKVSSRAVRLTALVVLLVAVSIPPLVVLQRPTSSPEPYVFEARLANRLGISTNGQLTYFQASALAGRAPAGEVVVSLDHGYTRGWVTNEVNVGGEYWMEGSLMTPEVFYGEQYIFYGPPQVYLRQIRTGVLWPDQATELRVLYLSPLSTLAAPIQLPLVFRSDGLSARIVAILGLRCVLIAATLTCLVRRRTETEGIILTLALYGVVAVGLTLFILGDSY